MKIRPLRFLSLFTLSLLYAVPSSLFAQEVPSYLRDRGPGIQTSIFGTCVTRGELLVSPFVEYYADHNFEYKPAELGYGLEQDFRGKYRATEGLLFLGYGVTDRLAIEVEAAVIKATLTKSPKDPSPMPAKLSQSGQGDMQMQLDYLLSKESATRPAVFSYFEVDFPSNRRKLLIGSTGYELIAGAGLTRGFRWGTVTGRASFSHGDGKTEFGEWAFEYLKRVSSRWRVYAGVEGTQDELELNLQAQWHINDRVYVRLNNGFGLTSKTVDLAPDLGIVFSLGGR
ncbi:MAG TPA: hypothetical protein VHL58_11635 [Thermoanaerobaculia bacterium]|nr:hypothetical protein [Thermoanaerobaculia bacterium]